MNYDEFLETYETIIQHFQLAENSFACFVVGEVKNGNYVGFVQTIRALKKQD